MCKAKQSWKLGQSPGHWWWNDPNSQQTNIWDEGQRHRPFCCPLKQQQKRRHTEVWQNQTYTMKNGQRPTQELGQSNSASLTPVVHALSMGHTLSMCLHMHDAEMGLLTSPSAAPCLRHSCSTLLPLSFSLYYMSWFNSDHTHGISCSVKIYKGIVEHLYGLVLCIACAYTQLGEAPGSAGSLLTCWCSLRLGCKASSGEELSG